MCFFGLLSCIYIYIYKTARMGQAKQDWQNRKDRTEKADPYRHHWKRRTGQARTASTELKSSQARAASTGLLG
jgi:hypothetical protein